ncbi:hypothetical protein LEP1GSC120_3168 [Leptospira santarosai str. 200702252]|nr:hypothetical protein LEP1GSC068_1808 [Leptospira sp. Fiocruz LV3954]EMI65005.1 hypothetical protein LEP1GSC076_0947 [Leptospira sp. Fiocruz LV4135]EMO69762.1 hypothetical protein LEP1GSC130_3677 [Leptospira santarosai str. 200403458]EMO97838.1 hypothetical protein LEP1GSC120_3168 [Leptospira santarosai str. 200702252]
MYTNSRITYHTDINSYKYETVEIKIRKRTGIGALDDPKIKP